MPAVFEDMTGEQQVFAEGCSIESLAFHYEMPEKHTHSHNALPKQSITFV
jgi:hypothetical protein